jgi:hypothetical protein
MPGETMEDPRVIAETHHLGNLQEEFKAAIFGALLGWTFLGLACLAVMVYILSEQIVASQIGMSIIIFLIGIACIAFCINRIIKVYNNRDTCVLLYDQGLFYRGRDGNLAIRWEDIVQVEHAVIVRRHRSTNNNVSHTYTTRQHCYTIRCFEGTYLKLDETIKGVRRLGKIVEERSAHDLLPQALRELLADQVVPFGAFGISMGGIYSGREMLPWNELKSVKVDEYNGAVIIRKQGKWLNWASARLTEVPNVIVFDALVRRMEQK